MTSTFVSVVIAALLIWSSGRLIADVGMRPEVAWYVVGFIYVAAAALGASAYVRLRNARGVARATTNLLVIDGLVFFSTLAWLLTDGEYNLMQRYFPFLSDQSVGWTLVYIMLFAGGAAMVLFAPLAVGACIFDANRGPLRPQPSINNVQQK
jgi:hypothetical protein